MNLNEKPETKPENEAIEETVNTPDEDQSEYNILKFEDEKIDKNKYKIKHAMKHTVGTDLLIKTETIPVPINSTRTQLSLEADSNNKTRSETWLIPVHKKVVVAKIPYFGSIFRNDWRDGENLIGSTEYVVAPEHISAKIVFAYVATKYYSIENPEADLQDILWNEENWPNQEHLDTITELESPQFVEFCDVENVLEFIDLAVFWSDETMQTKLFEYVDDLLDDVLDSVERLRLISRMFQYQRY